KISFSVRFTWSVFYQEVEFLEVCNPSCLSAVEILWLSEVHQILMISCHDCKHFFIINFIVPFCLV
ncbi:hypothetical protein AMATHDRAFT_163111, partial [Amanita thiersii Skay4041]